MLDRAAKEVATAEAADPEYKLAILESIGGSYMALGLPAQAIPLLQQVHSHRVQAFGASHRSSVESSLLLTTALVDANRPEDALKLAEDLVQQSRQSLGENHRSTLEAMHVLCKAYSKMWDTDKGLPLCESLVKACKANFGLSDSLTLAAMSTLGVLYSDAGRMDDSIAVLQEALELMKDRPNDKNTLETIGALGQTYRYVGRASAGHEMLLNAHELMRSRFGPSHRVTLAIAQQLVGSYVAMNRYDKAVPLQHELVEMTQDTLGPADPSSMQGVSYLAFLVRLSGQPFDTTSLFLDQVQRITESRGPEHIDTLKSKRELAQQYVLAGQNEDAQRAFSELIADMTRILGPIHRETLTTLDVVGRSDEAFAGWKALLLQERTALAPDDRQLLDTTAIVGDGHEDRGQFDEAEGVYRSYLATATLDSQVTEAKMKIGMCMLKQGRYAEGVRVIQDLLEEKIRRLDTPEARELKAALPKLKESQPAAADLAERHGFRR
jgi:tetratricopeptide (TPR) repeat protein